ncbi:MAG: MFS transporter [Anaerolineales bacterium]|nr:MFS transporter [Anaerolineales bacterium]
MTWLAYAIITLGSSTLWGVASGWLLYFYLRAGETPLVPLALYSVVVLISKAINIIVGMPVGYLSDHTNSAWGRRLPYIIGGAILLPPLFFLLWTPPQGNLTLTVIYLLLVLIAFNLVYEVHQVPYEALLPELAVGEKDRVAISSWKTGFLLIGNIFAGFTGPLISKLGYTQTMLIFAVSVAPIIILPGFFLRKRVNLDYQITSRISFVDSLKSTFGNRNFQIFALSWGLLWTGSTLVLETLPYIVTEVCGLKESDAVYFYLPAIGVTLLSFPLINRLSEKYGMKTIYRGSLLAGAVTLSALILIGDWIPIPLLAQGILWIVLQSASLAGAQILPGAMMAEITDHDEHITGQRREGSFYSVWGLLNQASSGLGLAVIPLFLLLGRSKLDTQGPLGVRLLGVFGGLLLLTSFWIFKQYKLENPPKSVG